MYKFLKHNTAVIILIIVAIFMSTLSVKAEDGKTLFQYGKDGNGGEITSSQFKEVELDRTKYDTNADVIETYADHTSTTLVYAGQGEESTRWVRYEKALNYFGTILTVEVIATVTEGRSRVCFVKNDEEYGYYYQLLVGSGSGNEIDITVNFYDENNNKFEYSGLYGLVDPDLGYYRFDNSSTRDIYYKNAVCKTDSNKDIANNMLVTENGLSPVDVSDDYDEGIAFIQLNNEDSFTVHFEPHVDWVAVPYLYSLQYNVTYVLNDSTDFPADNSANESFVTYGPGITKTITDPTRPGFEFLGWTRSDVTDPESNKKNSIQPDDTGDKEFVAQWKAIDYKIKYDPNNDSFPGKAEETMDDQNVNAGDNTLNPNQYTATGYKWVGWSTVDGVAEVEYEDNDTYTVGPDDIAGKEVGDYVGTLYAQWEPIEYTVKYDKNAEDAEGTMPDQTPLEYDQDYNLDPNSFTRKGYTWVGWNTEPDKLGTDYSDKQGFKNLTETDGGVVTMYAKWEPWKYNIKYDANGGQGEMKTQTFIYTDDEMNSKRNQFTRDGYEFTGFEYTYNGSKYFVTSIKDFNDILKELGPNSSITLVAQWKKLPDPVVKVYNLPVTGVDGTR